MASADVNIWSSHRLQTRTDTRVALRAWAGSTRPDFAAGSRSAPAAVVQFSPEIRSVEDLAAAALGVPTGPEQEGLDPQLSLLRSFVERITGKRMKLFDARELSAAADGGGPSRALPQGSAGGQSAAEDFGVEVDATRVYTEREHSKFRAVGTVRTQQGRTLTFELDLTMARSYQLQEALSLRGGAAARKDPLVLNFTGGAPQLSDARFQLDIDSDGTPDSLPTLERGNGFLALDINANGQIDSGAELFGAHSGDGFADLAAYDSDNNRAIDESDPVFAQLRIFVPGDGESRGALASLRELGVGALLLDRVHTPFTLRSSLAELGAVRSTGLYLTEAGQPGVMQQIDLVV